ncbi:hypothetical protein FACS189431_7310 [Alphaproteobacteria bacterium]|nr:hypothetical protein FACS189431_7310 [Alphaproteobacteria bacterium]
MKKYTIFVVLFFGALFSSWFLTSPVNAMSVDSVTASSGPESGGTNVTITGDFVDDLEFTQIATGVYHSCAIASNNNIYCWGSNNWSGGGLSGELGDGTFNDSNVPAKVKNASDDPASALPVNAIPLAIDVGTAHSCIITSDAVYCWGANRDGQLGINNSNTNSSLPVKVSTTADDASSALPTGVTFTKIATGALHTCAAISTGNIYCWGYNSVYGALGNGTTITSTVPVKVLDASDSSSIMPASTAVRSLTAGSFHTCALMDNNFAYCWGAGTFGQIGDGTLYQTSSMPYRVNKNINSASSAIPTVGQLLEIEAGDYHTCLLVADGNVYCWGRGLSGEMGTNNGTVLGNNPNARKVRNYAENTDSELPSGVKLVSLSAGSRLNCALGDDNNIYCWGQGTVGQLGDGTIYTSGTAVRVLKSTDNANSELPGSDTITVISASDTSCAIASGKTYCWGLGSAGQIGNGTNIEQNPFAKWLGVDLSLTVTFDATGTPADCINVVVAADGKSLTCITTGHVEGLVSVTVSNGLEVAELPPVWGSDGNIVSGFYYGTLDKNSGGSSNPGAPNTGLKTSDLVLGIAKADGAAIVGVAVAGVWGLITLLIRRRLRR